jgi:Flp pilus assembly protein TadG
MRREAGRGQALAEFALVAPVFMLLLAGMIQFGVILWGQNTLNQVVRDAGRFAATSSTCSVTDATNRVQSLSNVYRGPWTLVSSAAVYSGTPCPPPNNQAQVLVNVSATYQAFTFFPWVPGNGLLTSSADFRVEPMP